MHVTLNFFIFIGINFTILGVVIFFINNKIACISFVVCLIVVIVVGLCYERALYRKKMTLDKHMIIRTRDVLSDAEKLSLRTASCIVINHTAVFAENVARRANATMVFFRRDTTVPQLVSNPNGLGIHFLFFV